MTYELTAADTYRRMAFIRAFEEQVLALGRDGEVVGSVHLALGQEAIPVGAMSALEERDRVLSTYRGHGWALAPCAAAFSASATILGPVGAIAIHSLPWSPSSASLRESACRGL